MTRSLVRVPVTEALWAEALAGDSHAMADHTAQWVAAICDFGRYRDVTRAYRSSNGRVFVLPLVQRTGIAGVGGSFLSPPSACGFGGLIGPGLDAGTVAAVVDDLRALRGLRVSIRPDPLLSDVWGSVGGRDVARIPRLAHVLDLAGGTESVESRFSKKARQSVRQGLKRGVTVCTVRTAELLGVHYDLYMHSVERWAGHQSEPLRLAQWRARRRDPLRKLQAIARHLGDAFCHHVAYHDGRPVASSIVVIGRSAHDTRAAMNKDLAAPVRANEVLQAHAIESAIEDGCRFYHMGESGASESLAHSKSKFGAEGHEYDEIRIERMPLTRADTLARTAVKRVIGFRDT